MGKVIREKCHATVYEIIGIGAEKMQVILKADIIQKLKEIGLEGGDNVIVHTSLKKAWAMCAAARRR